jgi:hypothetical protein
MELTNHDKWLLYTSGLSSPQNFIEWSWLSLIAASLQRRVWCGPLHQPCYSNMYVILVGPPGVGKGLCIKTVKEFIRYWKKKDAIAASGLANGTISKEDANTAEMTKQLDIEKAQDVEFQGKSKGAEVLEPLLLPVAADATTYEALVKAVADSYSRCNYIEWSEQQQKNILKIYGHSSLCFLLEELASLLRKRTDDTVNYMLGLYDCPVDYEYLTKTQGKDRVRRGCLNILAGTTPSFMQSTFDEKLMDEGFSSRTFYIYSQKNRKNQFWIPAQTQEQLEAKKDILDHIRKLASLHGPVKIDRKTEDFLQDWWDKEEKNKENRVNKSLKMVPYYARGNIHTMKIAMAHHFGESLDMSMPLSAFEWAIEFKRKEEVNMHLALTLEGNNVISKVTRKILAYLETGEKNIVQLLVETHSLIDVEGLTEALNFLRDTHQIECRVVEDKDTQESVTYWRLIK